LFNKNMKNVQQKRLRRGRPATGRAPIIALRLSAEEIQLVDEFAAEWHVDRSKALRTLLREGFAACSRKQKRAKAAQRRAAAVNEEIIADVLAEADNPAPVAVCSQTAARIPPATDARAG
jgi:hypothetical protein